MLCLIRVPTIAAALALVFAAVPPQARAGDAAQAPAPAAGAPEVGNPDAPGDCPYRMPGAPCCAECQQKKQDAAAPPADCPCKRAKEAAEGAKTQH